MRNLANKRFSEILSDGFKLFFQIYGTIIVPLALFQVLLIILDVFLFTGITWKIDSLGLSVNEIMDNLVGDANLTESELETLNYFLIMNIVLFLLQNLLGAVIITIAMCSVSNYAFKRYMKEDVKFMESFKSSFNKRLFLVILIIGICLPMSSILLFFPAMIIFGFYIFLVFTYNIGDSSNPISKARDISRGAFWKIIGLFIINIIIITIINLIYSSIVDIIINVDSSTFIASKNSWYNPVTRSYGMIILYQILYSIIDILFAPLWICLLTSLFSSLKAKKDLKYQTQQGYYPVREYYPERYPQQQELYENGEASKLTQEVRIEGNFYCPFCGYFISSPKKFCPKCGESFSFMNQ